MFEIFSTIPGLNLALLIFSIILFSTLHISQAGSIAPQRKAEIILMYSIGITGFNGFIGFFVHTIWAEQVATAIGWPAGNLFQLEVAGANLAFGVLGYLGFWRRDFWLPYILAKFGFSWTAGFAHIIDIVERGNFAPLNAGPIIYWDFLVPVILLALYLYQRPFSSAESNGFIRVHPLIDKQKKQNA